MCLFIYITRENGNQMNHFKREPLTRQTYIVHHRAGPRSAVGSASDSWARGSGFDTRSGHILLPLIQQGQLSVTGELHEVLINRLGVLSLPRKSVVRFTDRPDMTIDVYCGRKRTIQQQHAPPWHATIGLRSLWISRLCEYTMCRYFITRK